MTKPWLTFSIPVVLALFVMGCAPDPVEVCDKLDEIYKDSADRPSWLGSTDECVDAMDARKKRKGVNSYRRYAECVFAARTIFDTKVCHDNEQDPRDK